MVCHVTSTAGGDTRALPSAQEDRHIVIHPHAPNKKTGSEYTADTYIAPFPKIRCLKHTHLVSSSISELLTSGWKTKRQHTETIRRLMPLSPYYQSSWGETKAGYLWEQLTKMKTPLWVMHQTMLQSDQRVTRSRAPRRRLLTLQMDENSKVLNFFNYCLVSCCFSSHKGKKRAQWIRKCWTLWLGVLLHTLVCFPGAFRSQAPFRDWQRRKGRGSRLGQP